MKVIIGSTEYDLKVCDIENEKPDELEGKPMGFIDNVKSRICISNELEKQSKLQTFWHEAVHGILDELGRFELNDDEGFVDSFSKQLYALFLRNNLDKIYSYIGEAKCKK